MGRLIRGSAFSLCLFVGVALHGEVLQIIDTDGDGAATAGDEYVTLWWLFNGGDWNNFIAEMVEQVEGAEGADILDMSEFFQSSFAQIPPVSLGATAEASSDCHFIRGDSNGDTILDISDTVWTLEYLFSSGSAPASLDSADADDGGTVDLSDVIYTLDHLISGAPAPLLPYPSPGFDPTIDTLDQACYPYPKFNKELLSWSHDSSSGSTTFVGQPYAILYGNQVTLSNVSTPGSAVSVAITPSQPWSASIPASEEDFIKLELVGPRGSKFFTIPTPRELLEERLGLPASGHPAPAVSSWFERSEFGVCPDIFIINEVLVDKYLLSQDWRSVDFVVGSSVARVTPGVDFVMGGAFDGGSSSTPSYLCLIGCTIQPDDSLSSTAFIYADSNQDDSVDETELLHSVQLGNVLPTGTNAGYGLVAFLDLQSLEVRRIADLNLDGVPDTLESLPFVSFPGTALDAELFGVCDTGLKVVTIRGEQAVSFSPILGDRVLATDLDLDGVADRVTTGSNPQGVRPIVWPMPTVGAQRIWATRGKPDTFYEVRDSGDLVLGSSTSDGFGRLALVLNRGLLLGEEVTLVDSVGLSTNALEVEVNPSTAVLGAISTDTLPSSGALQISLEGYGFDGTTKAFLYQAAIPSFTECSVLNFSSTDMTVSIPAGLVPGSGMVLVTNFGSPGLGPFSAQLVYISD